MPITLLDIIQNCEKILPHNREEKIINPAYYPIENTCPLPINKKRIWLLRTDLTLATGIKNIHGTPEMPRIYDLHEEIALKNHRHVDWNERYGHPSLAVPEANYDGSAYIAGWLAQRQNHIEIILSSGRYWYDQPSKFQKECLEIYVAKQLMAAWNNQNVVFYDYHPSQETMFKKFLSTQSDVHKIFPSKQKRSYTAEYIKKIDLLEQQGIDLTPETLEKTKRDTQEKLKEIIAEHVRLIINTKAKQLVEEIMSENIMGLISENSFLKTHAENLTSANELVRADSNYKSCEELLQDIIAEEIRLKIRAIAIENTLTGVTAKIKNNITYDIKTIAEEKVTQLFFSDIHSTNLKNAAKKSTLTLARKAMMAAKNIYKKFRAQALLMEKINKFIDDQIERLSKPNRVDAKGVKDKITLFSQLKNELNQTILNDENIENFIYRLATISHHRTNRTQNKAVAVFTLGFHSIEAFSWTTYKQFVTDCVDNYIFNDWKDFFQNSLNIPNQEISCQIQAQSVCGYDEYREASIAQCNALQR